MPLPVPTTIATGFADAGGCYYDLTKDRLYVMDAGAGTVSAVNPHSHVKTLLGSGYNAPSDIEISADGLHAYITENPGTLVKVSLTNMNRSAATVIASGLNGVDQLALDEAHGFAYVTEFTASRIQQIALTGGTKTPVVTTPGAPRGVLVTSDGRFIYVSTDAGTITRYDLHAHTNLVVASGLNGPRHITFADAGESVILFPQNGGNLISKLDLSTTPGVVTSIAGPAAAEPYSVAVLSSNQILIASATVIGEVDLTSSVFTAAGPILLGIGFVPADTAHLPGGFADTTADPTYFFQVKDCPFGGTLPLMINWEHAHSSGANFYQVFITAAGGSPVQVTAPFTDYLWSVALNEFEAQATSATGGFYPLRQAGQIWLNFWLGCLLDTTGQPNGLNTISIKLFSAQSAGSEIGHSTDPGRFATLMINNTLPTAIIQQIFQQPGNVPVNACGLVTTGKPTFTFEVTASHQAYLRAWSLTAYWGNNQSETVTSDSYAAHMTPTRVWTGVTTTQVPPPGPTPWNSTVAGDPTSTHCAHSFFLYAWDRVINGWGFIHDAAGYQQSMTILL